MEEQKSFMIWIVDPSDNKGYLLQTFSSAAVTVDNDPRTFAATAIGTSTFTAGNKISVSGCSDSTNNGTFTLETVAANLLTVTEETATEVAGASVVINDFYEGTWRSIRPFSLLTGTIIASQACTLYIDQSRDGINIDHTDTIVVGSAVAEAWQYDVVVGGYGRIRILNGSTDQTTMRCILNGKVNA